MPWPHALPHYCPCRQLNGEKVVASDDVKTSNYQVETAFNANFSYSPPSKIEEGKDDIDEPDIGTGALK